LSVIYGSILDGIAEDFSAFSDSRSLTSLVFSQIIVKMARSTRLIKSFSKLVLPVLILATAAVGSASVWLLHEISRPKSSTYLVTPQKYGQLSSRGAQITDESWQNADNTTSRGWLLRGSPNSPAVILLYRYGANRSHLLNLAVKLSEATNFTVLMPEMRGHGENPVIKETSFGGCEADDMNAAVNYLRGLRTPDQIPLVNDKIGIYGLEMGGLVAAFAAAKEPAIKALVLDSVPRDSDGVLEGSISRRYPFASSITSQIARLGTTGYYFDGCYRKTPACEVAKQLTGRKVLLLGGVDQPELQESTNKLSKCFPAGTTVDSRTDLSPSGFNMANASIETSEAYDQRVIDFLRASLSPL
jgi:pimeloyl-ACP methyl ester carboxylesterase